jgi:single stranded DNA-binding protein
VNGIQCALVGRLPRDAGGLRYTANGNPMLTFSVAVQDARRGDDDQTEWARIACFGELAEQLEEVLMKGDQVYVEGRIRLDVWHAADGDRPSLAVTAWTVQPMGKIGRRAPRRRRRSGQHGQADEQPQRMPEAMAVAGAGRDTRQVLGLDDDPEDAPF